MRSGLVEVAAVADVAPAAAAAAREVAPAAALCPDLEALLDQDLDGLVIATPSALHAGQAVRALEAGCAVFCQKPLGRNADETRRVVEAARRADRLLGVDFSYRHVRGVPQIREAVQRGDLGDVYAVHLVFHNAYGPDKPWFYDPHQAGGGCVMDLGIHLIDLAFWMLNRSDVRHVTSRLFAQGQPLSDPRRQVEDYAVARLDLEDGPAIDLACSWRLPAGREAVIEASFYGTRGGMTLRNVSGSFYDFVVERLHGTTRQVLAEPPDAWGGRAAVAWAERLAQNSGYDPEIEHVTAVAAALDHLYAAALCQRYRPGGP